MVTATGVKRAVGYFRVSSQAQAGEHHQSLETQEARYRDYCDGHGLAPVRTFVDVATGRRDDRKAYQEMLAFVGQGEADVIVVQFLDRFGRNPREILRRYWGLEEAGVSVVATDEDLGEEIQLLIKAFMAGAESRRISERVRSTMSRAVSKGRHIGKAPYGLRPVRVIEDSKVQVRWEIEPKEAEAIREMWRLAVTENRGYKAISARVTEMGYRTKQGEPFKPYTLWVILNNKALMGTLEYGKRPRKGNPSEKIELPGFFPAILNAAEWQQLQERLAIRREHPRGTGHVSAYLLSGILVCGHCGGPMIGHTSINRQGKRYYKYVCNRNRTSKALCDTYNAHHRAEIEVAILDYLGQFSDPARVRQHLEATDAQEADRHEAELKAIDNRLGELDRGFLADMERLDRGVINEAEFGRRNTARRQEVAGMESRKAELISKLEAERGKAAQLERVPVVVKTFLEAFQGMEVRQAKAQLQTILKGVHVYRGGKIELEFRE